MLLSRPNARILKGFLLLLALGLIPVPTTLSKDDADNVQRGNSGERVLVLTFDDAVKSHRTFVAPLLKELGFGATFFVTHYWMADTANFMSWEEIADINRMGFEIGNHSWTHGNFSIPKNAARLPAELALVENELQKVKVPKPVSFAFSGNSFGPEAVEQLKSLGYNFARRGMQPEVAYGKVEAGPVFDPTKHHPLLIPTSGDSYPGWTLEHFQKVVNQATPGKFVVLQFHGVPDRAHPWVHTPPELFREEMRYLKNEGFKVVALKDVAPYLPQIPPVDPMLKVRQGSQPKSGEMLPAEVEATRKDLSYWLRNMLEDHAFTLEEAAPVCGLSIEQLRQEAEKLGLKRSRDIQSPNLALTAPVQLLPYPGGRHPRIGFKEGAILPQRGTKASVFLPWQPTDYVVVDVPEAIFSNLGLTYLAHTHIPSIWDAQNLWLDNIDWRREEAGKLSNERTLPNKVTYGMQLTASIGAVDMELWLKNDSTEALSGLRAQVCVLLKGAKEFNLQTNENKQLSFPVAAVRSNKGRRWIMTAWERCGRVWANPQCPCMHSDPALPNCPPGQTVQVRGKLWFYEGDRIGEEIEGKSKLFVSRSGEDK